MTNQECANGLRKLADLLDANPQMVQPYEGIDSPIIFFCHSKESFAATVKAFGSGIKGHDEDSLKFTPEFPLRCIVNGFKSSMCEAKRVVVRVPEKIITARKAEVIPAHDEIRMVYECVPFIATATPQLEPARPQIEAAIPEAEIAAAEEIEIPF